MNSINLFLTAEDAEVYAEDAEKKILLLLSVLCASSLCVLCG
jgi:hypothetical protein